MIRFSHTPVGQLVYCLFLLLAVVSRASAADLLVLGSFTSSLKAETTLLEVVELGIPADIRVVSGKSGQTYRVTVGPFEDDATRRDVETKIATLAPDLRIEDASSNAGDQLSLLAAVVLGGFNEESQAVGYARRLAAETDVPMMIEKIHSSGRTWYRVLTLPAAIKDVRETLRSIQVSVPDSWLALYS